MTVVAGVDESPISVDVVARAIEEARWRGTDLHVAHATYLPIVYTDAVIDWESVAQAQRESVWAALAQVMATTDVNVQRVDLEGYPPDTLVGYANDVDATLLVLGTRGRGDLASLILGSTSHRAIHLSRCDVLVVKAPDSA